jgi:hypothetical protein
VFLERAAEIERFAHRLADVGLLVDGTAVIGPEHVCFPVLENFKREIALLRQQRALVEAGSFIPGSGGRLATESDKITELARINAAIAALESIIRIAN